MRRALRALAGLALLAVACSAGSENGLAPDAPRLVVLISIDTLRADHLGAYGYERPTSPLLDSLAADGVVFENAWSTAPWTLPAHASLLTGLYPSRHGATTQKRGVVPEAATLATRLAERGYTTAAVVNVGWLRRKFGLAEGFEHFEGVRPAPTSREPTRRITDRAMAWIREFGDRPLFLFLHYYDVHADYASLPRWEREFVSDYAGEATGEARQILVSMLDPAFVERCRSDPGGRGCADWTRTAIDGSVAPIDGGEDDRRHLVDLYDAGVRQMDAELKRLVDFLRGYGLLEDALLVVTSDHGDEFLEHGGLGHSRTQFEEMLHVPLVMHGAGLPAGVRVATPVSLVDVAPTLLARTGAPPPPGLDGLDLAPLWQGGARDLTRYTERALFAEASFSEVHDDLVRAVRRGRFKLVYDRIRGESRLFDLASDPGEREDVSARHPETAEALSRLLHERLRASATGPRVELDDAEAERLRALGYL